MKITFEFTDNDKEEEIKAKRMMAADTAFSLLWDIMDTIYRHKQNNVDVSDHAICSADQTIDNIEEAISESNLLDLWQ